MKRLIWVFLASLSIQAAAQEATIRDTLRAARVTTEHRRDDVATQTSMTRIDGNSIGKAFSFLGSPDLIKTLQQLPGVASGTELMSGLYVRGGDGADNLFLLDGIPMYQVSHLIGLFSSFNADIVDDVDFYKGGFPARFGGRLSSVVDVSSRDGSFDAFHGTVALGLIDGRLQLEGPIFKDRTSFNFSVRRTWLDAFTTPFFRAYNKKHGLDARDGTDARYVFQDLNFRLTHRFSERNTVSASFYHGNDSFGFQEAEFVDQEKIKADVAWGNVLASLEWTFDVSDRFGFRITPYYSLYRSDINAAASGVYTMKHRSEDEADWELFDFDVDEGMASTVKDVGVNTKFYWMPSKAHNIRFGASAQKHLYSPYKRYNETFGEEHFEGEANMEYDGAETAFYFEDEIRLARRLRLNLGIRDALFSAPEKNWNFMEPRAALRIQATDNMSFRASYAAMNQFSHQVAAIYMDLPSNVWLPSTKVVQPMHSEQVAGGFYANIGKAWNFSAEAFYKTMDHLYEFSGINSLLPPIDEWESSFTEGQGKAYGGEFEIGFRSESFEATAAYTLSWSERYFPEFFPEWYPDRNDNRHKITLSADLRLGKKSSIYASWNYHSGNRISAPTAVTYTGDPDNIVVDRFLYSQPNNLQLPDYHRLDIGYNWESTSKKGNKSILNISIYNAYCRMNAVLATVKVDPLTGGWRGSAYGLIPIIPSISYTFRF